MAAPNRRLLGWVRARLQQSTPVCATSVLGLDTTYNTVQRATYNVQRAEHNMQHTPRSTPAPPARRRSPFYARRSRGRPPVGWNQLT
jgi:hypothetical protein